MYCFNVTPQYKKRYYIFHANFQQYSKHHRISSRKIFKEWNVHCQGYNCEWLTVSSLLQNVYGHPKHFAHVFWFRQWFKTKRGERWTLTCPEVYFQIYIWNICSLHFSFFRSTSFLVHRIKFTRAASLSYPNSYLCFCKCTYPHCKRWNTYLTSITTNVIMCINCQTLNFVISNTIFVTFLYRNI